MLSSAYSLSRKNAARFMAVGVHVCIDPKADSKEMPMYDRFRTWYAKSHPVGR
jgi:hypothetical protein